MNILKATKRNTTTSGEINKLRLSGFIPAVLYGGKENNINISLNKLLLKDIINSETFMSKVFELDIDGSSEKVLPRGIDYDPVSDEAIHLDFIRIVKGSKLILEIPVKFINSEKSPGLKKGGVLNVVRRKIELKCPTENIPTEIILDLDKTEINTSLKISSVKLPENVTPVITDRDFVIAVVAAPTVLVEPEKTEEVATEGEVPAEAGSDGETKDQEGKEKSTKTADEKATEDKSKSVNKEKETKKK